MKIFKPFLLVAFMFVASAQVATAVDFVALDQGALNQSKHMIQNKNQYIMPAYNALIKNANQALTVKRFSVVDKPKALVAPSGDPHDFTSMAPYWWPNPATKNGLPWIAKDGQFNPETRKGDRGPFNNFAHAVENLSLAYYFTGEKKYAKKSAELLKAWFIDPATKMNSNLKYGQFIPGVRDGSGIGLIDMQRMPRVLDSILLISDTNYLNISDMVAINKWMTQFLDWMLNGEYGFDIRYHPNNHGTNYDVVSAGIALFLGDDKTAKAILTRSQYLRISDHLGANGEDFHELERTRPYNYSVFDLELIMALGQYSKRYDSIDFYHFTTHLEGVEKAVDFLNSYAFNLSKWKKDGRLGSVETSPRFERCYLAFAQASRVYGLAKYKDNLYKAWKKDPTHVNVVKWPVDFSK